MLILKAALFIISVSLLLLKYIYILKFCYFFFCHSISEKRIKNPTNRKKQTISYTKLIAGVRIWFI